MSTSSKSLPIRFGHFGINCFDLGKMEAFYTSVFGFLVSDRGYVPHVDLSLVFMTLEPTDHHQFVLCSGRTEGEIRTDAFIGGGAGSAINQMSFQLKDLDELRRLRDRFAEFGVTNGSPLNHGNAWAIYIRDIEGNPVELYVDTPWYTPQPFGEPLDLSLDNATILAQTEQMCRSRPGFEPVADWQRRTAAQLAARMAQR
jgi:catechol 2,3-dioxygenase